MKFDNLITLVLFLALIMSGGICAGVLYYDMGLLDTSLKTVNFPLPIQDVTTIPEHNVTDWQDIMAIVIYPFLGLRDVLPTLTYFMVFAFIIGLGVSAYMSSKNPIFFVVHLLFTFIITYFAIILSNAYRSLLENVFFNSMMVEFVIYNKLMLYLPQVIFFTSILFGVISFINIIKPQTNTSNIGLNYGGDY
jgi:hypothetical protein